MSHPRLLWVAVAVGLFWSSVAANAQPLGTFRWQLQPYCNVLTLSVVYQNGFYTLDGMDDRCGAAQAASASGVAFLNPNGTVGFGVSTVLPGGTPIHLEATLNLASLGGTWRDSSANTGTFVLRPGASSGGFPRPVGSGGIPAGSITAVHLAPNAVTNVAIAANAVTGAKIVDGSITGGDLANGAIGPAQMAANSVTGANIVDASITGADLASGAVGASAIAANAVTGSRVLDGSLTRADWADAPRTASSEISGALGMPQVDTTILQLTIVAPSAGRVLVNASGSFIFGNAGLIETAVCSLTTGLLLTTPYSAYATENTAAGYGYVPFGGTRAFNVASGSSTTFRLVCKAFGAAVGLYSPIITATFTPGL